MLSKEPTEVTTFSINWADWLGSLTIVSSSWSAPSGITIDSDTNDTTTTFVTLSGGTWGGTYELLNTIEASNGDIETKPLLVRIQRTVSYCTSIEVRRRMFGGSGAGGTATTNALPVAELEALIEQASRMFDLECHVPEGYFNPSPIPIAQSRTFYGDGTNYLRLDPYIAGSLDTSITLPEGYTAPTFTEQGGFLILNSEGVLPPSRRWGEYGWEYQRDGWWSGVPVTVSAIWGWRETPSDVKMAVIELVINLHRETDPQSLKLTGIEGQPLREKIPPRVLEVAKKYRYKAGPVFV